MVSFAYPFQKLQDWITQQWVIFFGRKFDPKLEDWLIGPFGELGSIGNVFFERLARREGLQVNRNVSSRGIIASIEKLNLLDEDYARLSNEVMDFYENTANYDLNFSVKWNSAFKFFGFLLRVLFSRRLNQLNIPSGNQKVSSEINSEIITLSDPKSGEVKYTIWYRTEKSGGKVIYSGVYTTCRLPSGIVSVKAIFPLPQGNATIILNPSVGKEGGLVLESSGNKFGDAGFYFLLRDMRKDDFGQNMFVFFVISCLFNQRTVLYWWSKF